MKGAERNKPCPCGSGLKAKKCDRLHLSDVEEAYRENQARDVLRQPRRSLAIPLILSAIAVPPRGR